MEPALFRTRNGDFRGEDCGLKPTESTFGAALGACGRAASWREAISLLKCCEDVCRSDLYRSFHVISIDISSFLDSRHARNACQDAWQPSVVSFSTVIAACEDGAAWQQALGIFEWMLRAAGA